MQVIGFRDLARKVYPSPYVSSALGLVMLWEAAGGRGFILLSPGINTLLDIITL